MGLKKVDRSAALSTTSEQIRDFAVILTERRGHEVTAWIDNVEATGAIALRSFAAGLRNDLKAVTAGLTMEYNSGPVEGLVNRIKMIKRQIFGRARFGLLRKRILNRA